MTKTIEEAAREFAKNRVGDYDYLGNEYEAYLDGSEDAVKWLFSLPLSQRLTDEERERVRKLYKRMVVDVENSDSYDCVPASDLDNAMETLESIFGKELFGEGEGC